MGARIRSDEGLYEVEPCWITITAGHVFATCTANGGWSCERMSVFR